jgi:hypothetical protein
MTREEIERRIQELEAQRQRIVEQANFELGRLQGQIELLRELLKEGEDERNGAE